MPRSGSSVPSVTQSLLLLWHLAPRKMRKRLSLGLLFRMFQTLCLACIFGVISLWAGAFVTGVELTSAKIAMTTIVVVALLLLQFFCAYRSVGCIWLTSFRFVGAIRHRLLWRLLNLPMAFHVSRPKADIAAALTGDLALIENLLTDGLPRLVHSLALTLFIACMMAWIDPATAALAILPIIAGLPLLFVSCRYLVGLSNLKQQAQVNATSRVLQWAEGMETVLTFGMLKGCRDAFTTPLSDIHRISVRMVASLTVPLLGFGAVVMSGLALLVAVAGYRYGLGDLSKTQTTMVLILALPLYLPLMGLAQFIEFAAVAHGAIARLNAIMAATTSQPAVGSKPSHYDISCDAVGFSYTQTHSTLKSVVFKLPERGLTAIIGPSGAGKSTLLQLLAGLLQPTEGRILIGGVDIRDIPSTDLHSLISVVFQDVVLFNGSVRDNIVMGNRHANQAQIEAAAQAAGAHSFISTLPSGYDTQIGENGLVLSGGERQRLSLARAILKDTPIILVDEGTASVDNLTAKVIAAALKEQAERRSVVVVTHLLSLVEGVDQVVYVDKSYA